MKRLLPVLVAVTLGFSVAASLGAEGKTGVQIEIGTDLGAGFYNDTVAGFGGTVGAAVELPEGIEAIALRAGGEFFFQTSSSTQHSQQDYYGMVRGEVQWFAFRSVEALAAASVRLSVGLGGGWTSDTANGATAGMAGFLCWPKLAVVYPVGPVELSLGGGYELIAGAATVKQVATVSLGCRYALKVGGGK